MSSDSAIVEEQISEINNTKRDLLDCPANIKLFGGRGGGNNGILSFVKARVGLHQLAS